jgi:hypothetical protein
LKLETKEAPIFKNFTLENFDFLEAEAAQAIETYHGFPKPWAHKPPSGKFLFFRGRVLLSLILGDNSLILGDISWLESALE